MRPAAKSALWTSPGTEMGTAGDAGSSSGRNIHVPASETVSAKHDRPIEHAKTANETTNERTPQPP
jgi:hypothetical protein